MNATPICLLCKRGMAYWWLPYYALREDLLEDGSGLGELVSHCFADSRANPFRAELDDVPVHCFCWDIVQ
jgi:hypothetical protein